MKPRDTAQLLDELVAYIRRFVVLTEDQAVICAVWILHTHVFQAAEFTAYLNINSAVMRSGKSRLLEVFKLFVASPWFTARVSAAVLVRKIAQDAPTLLLDECDTAFSADHEYGDALRGILNAGFQRGGCAYVCVKRDGNWVPQELPVFCPKAIAGIGDKLPPTVRDRSIPIHLIRQSRTEKAERFRPSIQRKATRDLALRIENWAEHILEKLMDAPLPEIEENLNDRQQDICDPLIQIGALAGDDWSKRLRAALEKVCAAVDIADESTGIQLLSDVRNIFDESGKEALPTAELLDYLKKIETSPWLDWAKGKGLSPAGLSRLLKPFGIGPRNIRIGSIVPKGYLAASFKDVWERYLPPSTASDSDAATALQSANSLDKTNFFDPLQIPTVADEEKLPNPHKHCIVASVADAKPEEGLAGSNGHKGTRQQPIFEDVAGEALCSKHGWHSDWFLDSDAKLCRRCHPTHEADDAVLISASVRAKMRKNS
jgi:hypothetical protein